jgi:chromosome segregation ATPase
MPVITAGHAVTEAPPPDPRHDMLWMSIGILLGYFAISVIIKGLDSLRGNRTAKLGQYVKEIDSQKNAIAIRERRISSLEVEVQTKDVTIQTRDNTILSERRARADAELEVERLTPFEREANDLRPVVGTLRNETGTSQEEITRLQPFETEANNLRPQVGRLRDEIRDKNREIASLKADITKLQGDLEGANQRFEVVNQRAAEGKDVERNLKGFIREREVALERIKAQHEEQLDTLREKHEDEKESLQQQREQDIEAVRRNANSELDAIIITTNRELVTVVFFNLSVPKVSGIVSSNVSEDHKQSTRSKDHSKYEIANCQIL